MTTPYITDTAWGDFAAHTEYRMTASAFCQYDSASDVIAHQRGNMPHGFGRTRLQGELPSLRYAIIKAVSGYAPYTHLIAPESGGYALARLESTAQTTYEIVTRENGTWQNDTVGEPNVFATEAEAWEAIESLKAQGDEWATAEYNVRPIRG